MAGWVNRLPPGYGSCSAHAGAGQVLESAAGAGRPAWAWRGPRWPAGCPRGRPRWPVPCRGRKSLSSPGRRRNRLPKALAELKKAAPPGARIMVGFDRGGAGVAEPGGPAGAGRDGADGGVPSPPPGPGGAADHRRGVLVAVCRVDAAARVHRGRWGRISRTWRGSGVSRRNRIWRSAGGLQILRPQKPGGGCGIRLIRLAPMPRCATVLPHLRTLRPGLAAITDTADPLALQEMGRPGDAGRQPGHLRGLLRR